MFPIIKTKRLILRPYEQKDVQRSLEYLRDYDISKMLIPVPYPYSLDDARWWIDFNLSSDPSEVRNWVIDDGSGLIGTVGARNLKGKTSIGYWVGKPHWGQGIMSEASRAVVAHLFVEMELPMLYAGAFEENPTSQHLLGKLGFKEVGREFALSAARGDEQIPHILYELPREVFLSEVLDSTAR
ncbi:GNAT family N-acetyltransferase [Polycladidibacter stylochi]|uniref:GNAT family N-acetyltransferase n=1 Tax=Polycladidibacter stylochi TaxID=1807766 RepID=UPI000829893D|nr:GNAT family N-acetyltransferase [Pseudovibrio stylochi]